jgi:hypothetical protein
MNLVKEHINFQRGLEPRRAMNTGILNDDLKFKMNGVIAEYDIGWAIEYVEVAEWRDRVDEETGEVGWPYIYISVDLKDRTIENASKIIIDDLLYIFKVLGIKGKLECSSYNIFEYDFYPDSLKEAQHFTRGLEPKKAMGIGYEKSIRNQIESMKGKFDKATIELGIEALAQSKRLVYLGDANKEELYIWYKLLGSKAIRIITVNLERYVSALDVREYGLESNLIWDNALGKAYNTKIKPIISKKGEIWEYFYGERMSTIGEFIIIKIM